MYGRDTDSQMAYQQQVAEKMRHAAMQDQCGAALGGFANLQQIAPHGPLESAIEGVTSGIQEAFSALDRLAEGLHMVLQPEMPSPTGDNNKACARPPTSPAVNRLHGMREGLEVLTSRMNALRCRLDS